MRHYKLTALAAAITCGISVGSYASDFAIEEVMVTAQKRAESVTDIGVTVSAFGGTDIKELGFEKPQDVAANTPGLSTANATSGGTPIFAIRGIGLDDFNSNNSSGVGVYIDEVLAAYPVFLNGQLFDVERIEVLKGPQGTLYGKNTTGGAINYVSVKPSDEFEAYVSAGVSRWNTYKIEGAVSGELTDAINSRLAVSKTDGDGWQEDIDTGKEYGDKDIFSARSLSTIDISDTASMVLNLHYTKDKSTPISPQNLTVDNVFGLPLGTLGVTSRDASDVRVGGFDLQRDEEGYGGSVNLTVDFDDFTLTSITAVDSYERSVIDNYDGFALSTGDFTFEDEFDVYSQEFRLTSNNSDGFSWVAGLVYSYDEVSAETTVHIGDLIDGIIGPGVVDQSSSQSRYTQETTSLGAYLHTETDLTETLSLTVGLRYSQDERDFEGETIDIEGWTALLDGFPNLVPGLVGASLNDSETESNVSGKVGLDYSPNDDWLIYGNVATSYKSGLFYASPAAAPEALSYVEPEEVLAYELGFKGSLLENTMQINGAFYLYEYDDRQSLVIANNPSVPGAIFATLGNVEESEISGAELELRWLPLANLDLRAGVSYIDSEVSKAPSNIRGLTLALPINEGENLSQAPQWSYSVVARYEFSLGDALTASAQAQYSWTDEQYATLADPQAVYGEVDNLGLRFSLEPDSGEWLLSAWVDNLENHSASTIAFTSSEGGQLVYRQVPRNYGIEMTYNF